jgi:hypothetical protein
MNITKIYDKNLLKFIKNRVDLVEPCTSQL